MKDLEKYEWDIALGYAADTFQVMDTEANVISDYVWDYMRMAINASTLPDFFDEIVIQVIDKIESIAKLAGYKTERLGTSRLIIKK